MRKLTLVRHAATAGPALAAPVARPTCPYRPPVPGKPNSSITTLALLDDRRHLERDHDG